MTVDPRAAQRDLERAHAPIPPGDPNQPDREIQALVRAQQQRRLTDAEPLRLAALTFASDTDLERIRLLYESHPAVYAEVASSARVGFEAHRARRQAAIDAGKRSPRRALRSWPRSMPLRGS